jgi:hypothetical protein
MDLERRGRDEIEERHIEEKPSQESLVKVAIGIFCCCLSNGLIPRKEERSIIRRKRLLAAGHERWGEETGGDVYTNSCPRLGRG